MRICILPSLSCVDLIDLASDGWWVLIVACCLLFLTLYYLIRASTTDPGIFLRLPPEPAYKWHAIAQEHMVDGKNVQLRYCRKETQKDRTHAARGWW